MAKLVENWLVIIETTYGGHHQVGNWHVNCEHSSFH